MSILLGLSTAPPNRALQGSGAARYANGVDPSAPPGWRLDDDGNALLRTYRFADFAAAFAFLTRVAAHAQSVDHHPEFTSVWNRVDFRLTSHDAGGVTARDVALAVVIDRLSRQ